MRNGVKVVISRRRGSGARRGQSWLGNYRFIMGDSPGKTTITFDLVQTSHEKARAGSLGPTRSGNYSDNGFIPESLWSNEHRTKWEIKTNTAFISKDA